MALVARSGELAVAAGAAAAKAEVEAAHIIAMKQGRDWDEARQAIMRACNNSDFAETALGKRPVGGGKVWREPTIRFVEVGLQAAKHMRVVTRAIYSDEFAVVYQTSVTDLVNNQTYSKEFRLERTVERKSADGRDVVGERTNSNGQKTYIVIATEDEMNNKIAANESKAIRTLGMRLIPEWIKAEAKETLQRAKIAKVKQDPEAYRRKLADAFSSIGISVAMLKDYLGHTLESLPDDELADLRSLYEDLKDGSCKWSDVVGSKKTEPESGVFDVSSLRPGEPPPPKDNPEPVDAPAGSTSPKRGRPPGSRNRPKESPPSSAAEQGSAGGSDIASPAASGSEEDGSAAESFLQTIEDSVVEVMANFNIAPSRQADVKRVLAAEFDVATVQQIPNKDWEDAMKLVRGVKFIERLRSHDLLPLPKED